jgi:phosphomevalonate kinase
VTANLVASAPGKLILTGEYAVLDGAPALVIAVDRRAVASHRAMGSRGSREAPHGSSPFLIAVADELAQRFGSESIAACAALEVAVDSSAFYDGAQKLGLGSSAAVTVAAAGYAIAAQFGDVRGHRDALLAIALSAHARAQGARGARGSGADIAAAVYGGAITYTMPASHADAPLVLPTILRGRWPQSVTLIPFFTGMSADTATLVIQVQAARQANPVAVDAALGAIAEASRATCAALGTHADLAATGVLAGLRLAAVATDRLAQATGVDLVPPCVAAARTAMQALGGTAKTTGAGGGDVAIAAIPSTVAVTKATRLLIELGCQPVQLSVDDSGVDTRPVAQ